MCALIGFSEIDFIDCWIEVSLDRKGSHLIFAVALYFAVRNHINGQFVKFHLEVDAKLIVESIPALFLFDLLDSEDTSSDLLHCVSPHSFKAFALLELSLHKHSPLFRLVLKQEMIVVFLIAFDSEISLFAFALASDLLAFRLVDDIQSGEVEVYDYFSFVLIVEGVAEVASPDRLILSHGYFSN